MKYLLTLTMIIFQLQSAAAEFWNLPQELSAANTSVTFEVDSTWHLIEGKVKVINGKLWLGNSNDFSSVQGIIEFPVSAFDTDNKSRDEEMQEVMNAKQYPTVKYTITDFESGNCNPSTMLAATLCQTTINGTLVINNVTKNINLSASIKKNENAYQVSAYTTLKWSDFNVEDPSIFIAKLHKDVNIKINLNLTEKK